MTAAEERRTWTIYDGTDRIPYTGEFPPPLDGDGEQVGIVYLGGDGDPDEDRVRVSTGPAAYKFSKGIPLGRGQWVWAMDRRWFRNRPRYAITDVRFDHQEERARREREAAVAEAKRQMAPIIEMIGSDVEEVKARLPKKGTSGRPKMASEAKKTWRAHQMLEHEGGERDAAARELYPREYAEDRAHALKLFNDAAYRGRQACNEHGGHRRN